MRESDNVTAGRRPTRLFDVNGFTVGLMTCYDVRFPEMARLLAVRGADVLVLPAAWVKGPLKEHHWRTLVTARALENTVYVVASGECGPTQHRAEHHRGPARRPARPGGRGTGHHLGHPLGAASARPPATSCRC